MSTLKCLVEVAAAMSSWASIPESASGSPVKGAFFFAAEIPAVTEPRRLGFRSKACSLSSVAHGWSAIERQRPELSSRFLPFLSLHWNSRNEYFRTDARSRRY